MNIFNCAKRTSVVVIATILLSNAASVFSQNQTGVVGWGRNDQSQITAPASLPNAQLVAAGYNHNLALRSDGTVIAWGSDSARQTSVPSSLTNVAALAAGQFHSLALRKEGSIVGWGGNFDGQISIPNGLTNAVAIAAGGHHSLAIKSGGAVVGWGDNSLAQAAAPKGLAKVISIAAGHSHSLALKQDGTVVTWGKIWNGAQFIEPIPPAGLSNIISIAAGHFHCLALKSDGTVAAWGDNSLGQSTSPRGLSNVISIAGGGYHSLALKSDGTVAGWGNNFWGQATPPSGFGGIRAITAGTEHSLALQNSTAPSVVIPPRDQTVTSGQSLTFAVFAAGSAPLQYQWFKNEEAIGGSTNAVHIISGVKFADAGTYRVRVSNAAGSTNVSASLAVGPLFNIVSTNSSGGAVNIPIRLVAAGNENAAGFSVQFNTNILRFTSAKAGADATNAVLNINSTQATSGRFGLAIALAANTSFAAGDREVAVLTFQVVNVSITQETAITFGSDPIAKQVSDVEANTLSGEFRDGTLAVNSGVEADLDGNSQVTVTDVARIGRIAARLDTAGLTTGQLQRADCAPLLTGGDGKVGVNDWVQAARFAVNLDPLRGATGPAPASLQNAARTTESPSFRRDLSRSPSEVTILNSDVTPKTSAILIRLQARGQENALGFTLGFNPAQLQFLEAKLGNLPANGIFLVNTGSLSLGTIGIVLALPAGASFPAGPHDVLRVSFGVSASAAGTARIDFSDEVVFREVASVEGTRVLATFSGGTLSLIPAQKTELRLGSPIVSKPGQVHLPVRLSDGQSFNPTAFPNLRIFAGSDIAAPLSDWTKLNYQFQSDGGLLIADDAQAAASSMRFYRLME